ncbi:MAG: inorganic diphosphatase [Candidatus Shapirobacteria bacterium]|jgi:inorganic pyrophosphatase|nr:inorganic diphosphatase [Candidatus Shapirobacteria bacterium]
MNSHITLGDKSPKIVNAIVEIVKQTSNKYEYDEKLEIIKLDRVLHSPMYYPVDYGFIPETRSKDGDHLDVMIITDSPVFTGCLLEVRPVGVLIMSDENGIDEKILAVPLKNPNYSNIEKIADVSEHFLKELVHFFTEYKRLENNKDVKVEGWLNRKEAYAVIKEANQLYRVEQKQKELEMALASSIQG